MRPRARSLSRLPAAAALLLLAGSAQAIEFTACQADNNLPLAFRILELSKAQLRYIHWVKVWRYSVNAGDVGKAVPRANQLKDLADDLRADHRKLEACVDQLIREQAAASPAEKANTAKTIQSLSASRRAIAKLESALSVSEFKLDQRAKSKPKSKRR